MFQSKTCQRVIWSFLCLAILGFGSYAVAQQQGDKPKSDSKDQGNATVSTGQGGNDEGDPLKRPPSDKQKKENSKALKQEFGKSYKKWLSEDVAWIITDEERQAFKQLSNDEERDNFIEAFWQRRDPTPDTEENEFKEEHYRRIEYANEHYRRRHSGMEDRPRPHVHHVSVRRMRMIRIHRAVPMNVPWKKAAARLPLSRSKIGAIATLRELDRKSSSSSSIPACAATTT